MKITNSTKNGLIALVVAYLSSIAIIKAIGTWTVFKSMMALVAFVVVKQHYQKPNEKVYDLSTNEGIASIFRTAEDK